MSATTAPDTAVVRPADLWWERTVAAIAALTVLAAIFLPLAELPPIVAALVFLPIVLVGFVLAVAEIATATGAVR